MDVSDSVTVKLNSCVVLAALPPTVFVTVRPPKVFLVFVNARVAGNSVDLWKAFKQHTSLLVKLDASYEKRTGVLIYEREFEKCTLLGQHAIKTKFKEYFKDSRYDKPVETYAEEYMVIINGYFLTIALKIPKELYDTTDCRDEISKVFQGFRYSVKH